MYSLLFVNILFVAAAKILAVKLGKLIRLACLVLVGC
jgi:hypothetical protein